MANITSIGGNPIVPNSVQPNTITDPMLAQTGGVLSREAAYELSNDNYDFGFVIGSINNQTFSTPTNRIRSNFIPVTKGDIFTVGSAGNILSVHLWGTDGDYVAQVTPSWTNQATIPSGGYAIVLLRKLDDSTIDESEVAEISSSLRLCSGDMPLRQEIQGDFTQNALVVPGMWSNKIFNTSTGRWTAYTNRLGMQKVLTLPRDVMIAVEDGWQFGLSLYSSLTPSLDTMVWSTGWITQPVLVKAGSNILVNVRRSNDSGLMKPYEAMHVKFDAFKAIDERINLDSKNSATWFRGVISANGTISDGNYATNDIVSYPSRMVLAADVIAVMRLYANNIYLGKINSNDELDKLSGNWKQFTGSVDLTAILNKFAATAVQVSIRKSGTTITQENAQEIGDSFCTFYASNYVPMSYLAANRRTDNSVVGPDFVRRAIRTTNIGTLALNQGFCVYDGKYYSIDSSNNISVQDASFDVVNTGTINVGHGNSLQLGSNGIAYASGWNDNKVYAVDLATLLITSTYTLPTTGYTTAAVDDANGIMYIFQRDSYPDTITAYNFITYDYVNQQVISTKKIKAFAAMQGCDYYEGRIIAAYGLGTSTAPSGMFVCNTNGDILAEYDLSIFASTEPECVCFDRDTHELLVSLVNSKLYKIESA